MKVILLESISKLGKLGDIVNVRSGYARNFLFPQKKAERAEASNIKLFEQRRTELNARQTEQEAVLAQLHKKLEGYTLSLIALASPDGNLYGSITGQLVANAINEQKISDTGINFKRGQIIMPDGQLKTLGNHKIGIKINDELTATITVEILTETKQSEKN